MLLNKLFHPALLLVLAAAAAAADDECSDLSSPQCCFDAHMDWKSSKSVFEKSTKTVVDYAGTYVQDTYTDVPTTTLCDGFLRYLGPRSGEISLITVPAEGVTTWVSTPYPTSAPSCTINEDDCSPYIEDYKSSSSAHRSNTSLPAYTHPPCNTYMPCPREDDDGVCKIWATGHTLWYWPVTVEGDLCGERTTITHPDPTRSTVISGTTFVSPSIYLSIESLDAGSYAGRFTATDCGRSTYHDLLLTMDPTDVSTHIGKPRRNLRTFKQLDLADLLDPTPVTAYFGLPEAPDCDAAPENCTESIEPSHTPHLSAPMELIRGLDPDYEFCDMHPLLRDGIEGPITWIPLEQTQGLWPEPTGAADGEEDEEDEEDEEEGGSDAPSVTQVISTTQVYQDSKRFRG